MQLNNMDIPKFITPVKSYHPDVLSDWQSRRNQGESAVKIGSLYGVSDYIVLKNTNTPEGKVKNKANKELAEKWQEMRNKGASIKEISEQEGFCRFTVSKWTKKPYVENSVALYALPGLISHGLKQEVLLTLDGVVVGTYTPKDKTNG